MDILVLVQKTPFINLQYKEINRLFKKSVFVVIIKKNFYKASIFLTCTLLIKLSTLILIRLLKS